jgi:Tol biopolymer transport system component
VRERVCLGVTFLGVFAALLAPGTAAADYGPIQLVSKSAGEQADEASAPAISADGSYLAFRGVINGLRGVFRKDLETGAVVPVAAGSAYEGGAPGVDSSSPSISADGRYVSFTTKSPLDPADDGTVPSDSDVYVADMSTPASPTYELASALDGSQVGLSYEGSGGSVASGRVAMSADGREVAFYTTAKSDLTSGPGGSTEEVPTPAGQVVLRNLETMETTLVSAERDPETGAMTDLPVPGGAMIEKPQLPLLKGAALSADGTTVAWLGTNLQSQVPLLSGEAAAISAENGTSEFPYGEPLWRRIGDGSPAPTRRIVGGDPSAPFVGLAGRNTELNFAQGWLGVQGVDGVPQLSANGRTVALIGNPTDATNAFVVDMSDGLSRAEAVRQLTREVTIRPTEPQFVINQEPYVALNGHIYTVAISPGGKRVTFATARQRFPLAPPNLIGSPTGSLGLVELYSIDLEAETLQRVTHGTGGIGEASLATTGTGQGGAGAGSPSFGAGGRLIAFSSTASNLVEGDGNEASDAFLVEDLTTPPTAGGASISPPPAEPLRKPRWRLVLSAFSLPSGDVRLVATVPAAGAVRARVGAKLGSASASSRRLATTGASARGGGPVPLTLRLPRHFRRLAHSREGLYATVRVSFHGAGGKPLHGELEVRFHAHPRGKGRPR